MSEMFRGMTKEEWKDRDNLFEPAWEMKSWVKGKNEEDVNEVKVLLIQKGSMLGRSVATTNGYVITYMMNSIGSTIEFPEEDDIFKVIQKATELINFIKL